MVGRTGYLHKATLPVCRGDYIDFCPSSLAPNLDASSKRGYSILTDLKIGTLVLLSTMGGKSNCSGFTCGTMFTDCYIIPSTKQITTSKSPNPAGKASTANI
jgi:hypothetical protein